MALDEVRKKNNLAGKLLDKRLRVAINAQVRPDSGSGGIATVLAELTALGQLEDGPEEYVFIGPWDEPDWLQPLLNSRQRIVRGPRRRSSESFKRRLGPLRPVARQLKSFLTPPTETNAGVPSSDGFYESLGCDVIHFPFQTFVRCELPTIYNPHDLQHLHHPEFFAPSALDWRATAYPSACHAAHTVVVASQFVKQDIVRHYGVRQNKVQVIPWAPPPATLAPSSPAVSFSAVRKKYALPNCAFALYPAMTWEHKNHLRLLEALAHLRDRRALRVNLVCTGHQTDFWPRIERRLLELELQEQVKFVGLVSYDELRAIYRSLKHGSNTFRWPAPPSHPCRNRRRTRPCFSIHFQSKPSPGPWHEWRLMKVFAKTCANEETGACRISPLSAQPGCTARFTAAPPVMCWARKIAGC